MATKTIASTINSLMIGSADQKALIGLFNALVDDLEALRAKNAALAAKLDLDATVTDVNYASTSTVAAGGLSVGK